MSLAAGLACGPADDDTGPETEDPGVCILKTEDTDPDYTVEIGCRNDFEAVASPPLVASIPGALSAKTVIDRIDANNLYFQNSRRYPIHWSFASAHLSGNGLPLVPSLTEFNRTEYYAPDRRFLLGALDYYEGPKAWVYEVAPYDTSSAEMIASAFHAIESHLWVGEQLAFHPTSDNVAREAEKLGQDIPVMTTDELFAGILYQPLNLATAMGRLRFFSAADLETEYLTFRDIAVLEVIPNDLAVCSGTITDELQTPLSHINVLAQNRKTPNMALRGAFTDPALRAYANKWVELSVGPTQYSLRQVTQDEADTWWQAYRPPAVMVPAVDLTVTDLRDIEDLLNLDGLGLEGALAAAIPAFGGKASHFAAFPHIEAFPIPYPKAFVVPVYYYDQFIKQNGFDAQIDAMLLDPDFRDGPEVRETKLRELRDAIEAAPVDPAFEAALVTKLSTDYPNTRMKFRSSTNCEDLDGFTGAGLYQSAAGDPNDPTRPYLRAVRKVWASIWRFRAFEEREYRAISHREVAMALLVHRSYPAEDANGVAITANIFDPQGIEPGFYINAQVGETSVVLPPSGVTSDQFLLHYDMDNQPMVFLGHSNLVPQGATVLSRGQALELGEALTAIHAFFGPVYGPEAPTDFYAMDVEFKFNTDPGETESELVIKQARPYPGRGQ